MPDAGDDDLDTIPSTRPLCPSCGTFDRADECEGRGWCEGGCDACREMYAVRARIYGELWDIAERKASYLSPAIRSLIREIRRSLHETRSVARLREWWTVLAALRYQREHKDQTNDGR